MYERFTDDARRLFQRANKEAQRFNHEYIGTEHILLGLVKGDGEVAVNILKNLDVDPRKVRLEVEKLMHSGPDMGTVGKLPQTPRAKRVIEYAQGEARVTEFNYVSTEQVLIGLLREQEGVAAQVLTGLGVTLEAVRAQVAVAPDTDTPKTWDAERGALLAHQAATDARIRAMTAQFNRLLELVKIPNPARDIANEANELLAAKDRRIEQLERQLEQQLAEQEQAWAAAHQSAGEADE